MRVQEDKVHASLGNPQLNKAHEHASDGRKVERVAVRLRHIDEANRGFLLAAAALLRRLDLHCVEAALVGRCREKPDAVPDIVLGEHVHACKYGPGLLLAVATDAVNALGPRVEASRSWKRKSTSRTQPSSWG